MECRENFNDNINNSSFIIKNINKGLTDEEVIDRIARGEINKIPKAPSRTMWQMIKANFLIYLML